MHVPDSSGPISRMDSISFLVEFVFLQNSSSKLSEQDSTPSQTHLGLMTGQPFSQVKQSSSSEPSRQSCSPSHCFQLAIHWLLFQRNPLQVESSQLSSSDPSMQFGYPSQVKSS